MLTLVSKFTDCYLSGQCRSPLSILGVQLPHHWPPGVCFLSTKFEPNRLRRLLTALLHPLVGFQISACILHANSTGGAAHCTLGFVRVHLVFCHNPPSSIFKLWTWGSYNPRRFHHTARSGNFWSHFSVNPTKRWWLLFFTSFDLRTPLLLEPVLRSETKLSPARPNGLRPLCSTYRRRVSLSW